jgi:transcriptional regulator with PAS, ATPase and Fis domain
LKSAKAHNTKVIPIRESPLSTSKSDYQSWIAKDPASQETLKIVDKVKNTSSTLLIQGESGTGKDLLAGLIHDTGCRREEPFLKIDCSSIPIELMESELMGYEKGAFTGAFTRKLGKLEFAGAGTIVLDDIVSLTLGMQAKLLRVIEERVFERLGGNEAHPVKARIIALSNENLEEAVRQRSFREDLYFRLSVIPIRLLPLRQRVLDIKPLAEHFLQLAKMKYARPALGMEKQTFDLLQQYAFPGNVRELRNILERAVMLADSETLTPDHLPELLVKKTWQLPGMPPHQKKPTLEELEKSYITEILEYTRGKKGKAAAILGISRKTLLEKRKRYELMD